MGGILDGFKLVKPTEKESGVCLFVAPVASTAKSKTMQKKKSRKNRVLAANLYVLVTTPPLPSMFPLQLICFPSVKRST